MSAEQRWRIGIVIPWFGRELTGGAELHTWQIASRLAARGHHVEVLTTCCRSHQDDWETNHIPAGSEIQPEGFVITRFPVEPRRRLDFDLACGRLLGIDHARLQPGVCPVPIADADTFCDELIKAPELVAHLVRESERYDRFLFIPYLYTPIIHGLSKVAEKAYLQPCLHNESYAYLPRIEELFRKAHGLIFNSQGEMDLAAQLFGPGILPRCAVAGAGIELPANFTAPISSPSPYGRFALFLGRKTAEKGIELLVAGFRRHIDANPSSSLKLVLAGHGAHIEGAPSIIDLGLISEEEKWSLLRHATAVVIPSPNESYSRVLYEGWFCEHPVIVHRDCLATAAAVRECQGGWLARNETEWAAAFDKLEQAEATTLSEIGARGAAYAHKHGVWDRAIDRYESVFSGTGNRQPTQAKHSPRAIHQLLPNLAYGDAISNEALFIRNQLRARGFESDIYARYIDERVWDHARPFHGADIPEDSALIYHHSIGSEVTAFAVAHRGPKALIYHNITPPEFYLPFRPEFSRILAKGLQDLTGLAPEFPLSVGVSAFNAAELAAHGFSNPGVLPLCIEPAHWNHPPDSALMSRLQDGRTNLLFVGRIAPNKKQCDLLRAFRYYLKHDPEARLHLVGSADTSDVYLLHLRDLVKSLGIERSVNFAGHVNDSQLQAYYRTAHVFWSMSEHEGFCVPVIEAMWFDLPVFAFKSSAVPETLGTAGLLFRAKHDLASIAAATYLIRSDESVRETIIDAQRKQRASYLPDRVGNSLDALLEKLLPTEVPA